MPWPLDLPGMYFIGDLPNFGNFFIFGGNKGIFNVILIYYIRHINPISSNGYHGMAEEIESTTTLDAETEWTTERY